MIIITNDRCLQNIAGSMIRISERLQLIAAIHFLFQSQFIVLIQSALTLSMIYNVMNVKTGLNR